MAHSDGATALRYDDPTAEIERLKAQLDASRRRLDETQALAHMGSYDWEIATDTNTWSDELYRIYGTEPQSFNASYDRFLAFLHPEDREQVMAAHRTAYETGKPYVTEERIFRPDGTMRVLATNGEVLFDESGTPLRVRGICWDVTDRKRAEEEVRVAAMRIHDAEIRRRQALDLNDNLLQGITSTLYSLEAGAVGLARDAAEQTLAAARDMITSLLGVGPGEALDPGELVRERPAPQVLRDLTAERRGPRHAGQTPMRVLLVDDAVDIRAIMRINLELSGAQIVGEAGTGTDAIVLATELQPDIVLLDLAMPGMDGLESLPLVCAAAPGAKVVIMSGFAAARMRESALALGAAAYVEKGMPVQEILELLRTLCPDKQTETWTGATFATTASTELMGDAARAFMDELRTPLTVVTGLVDTIRQQGDRLPSATMAELWSTLARNVSYLTGLLLAYDDTTIGVDVPAPRQVAAAPLRVAEHDGHRSL